MGLSASLDRWAAGLAQRARDRPVAAALLVAALVAAAGAAAGASGAGHLFEVRLGLPALYWARGAREVPPEVAMVAMDNVSALRIHLPREDFDSGRCDRLAVGERSLPGSVSLPPPRSGQWPRCLHARLLDALAAAGARVVAFDVLFRPRPGVQAGEDAELAAALGRFDGALLAEEWQWSAGDDCEGLKVSPMSAVLLEAAEGSGPVLLEAPGEQPARADRWLSYGGCPPGQPTLPMLAWAAFWREGIPEALAASGEGGVAVSAGAPASALLLLRAAVETRRPLAAVRGEAARRLVHTAALPDHAWFNLYGPPGTLPTLTYDEVLSLHASDPSGLARRVQGRAVWVGYADYRQPDQYDHFPTAFPFRGPTGTSGVELAATAFANLVDGSGIEPPGATARALACAAVAAGSVLAAALLSAWVGAAAWLALWLAAAAAVAGAFRAWHQWWPAALPLFAAAPAGFAAGTGVRFFIATLHRELFRRAAEKVLPREVVRAFGEHGEAFALSGEEVDCVCLSTDAQGFTARAESVPASEVRRQLNAYFESIFAPVRQRGGFISDVVGDAVLALWPVRADPVAAVAARVYEAALEARRASSALGGFLSTRLGVAFGRVSLGPVGALDHFEYRAVGDAVNVSSRVEQENKAFGTRILVADPPPGVEGFLMRDLGVWPLRGRAAPVRLVELVATVREATARERELVERFGRARALLDRGETFLARQVFDALARDFPDDGPTRRILEHWTQ